MEVSGASGALIKSLDLMGWVFRNSFGGGGRISLDFLYSRWVRAPRLVFGTMCSVGNSPLRQQFRSCIAFLALGMLYWQVILSYLMTLFSGTLILL